jgi:hypothetical protein
VLAKKMIRKNRKNLIKIKILNQERRIQLLLFKI